MCARNCRPTSDAHPPESHPARWWRNFCHRLDVPLFGSDARRVFQTTFADALPFGGKASRSFFGGFGFSFNTTLNDELLTFVSSPHRQMTVCAVALRVFNIATFGIFSEHRIALGPPMKNWHSSVMSTCVSTTTATSLSDLRPSRDVLT